MKTLLSTLAISLALSTAAMADNPQAESYPFYDRHLAFCQEWPEECTYEGDSFIIIDGPSATIDAVQAHVNAMIEYESEPVGEDVWRMDVVTGDCEEYVFRKRSILRQLGFPTNAMTPLVVDLRNENNDVHLVLGIQFFNVSTGNFGVVILDNNVDFVYGLHQMPFEVLGKLPKLLPDGTFYGEE